MALNILPGRGDVRWEKVNFNENEILINITRVGKIMFNPNMDQNISRLTYKLNPKVKGHNFILVKISICTQQFRKVSKCPASGKDVC